jgi:hypothetical protein
MNINVNHPTFISFIEKITNNILSNVSLDNYFNLPQEKKLGVQYVVFKLLKNTIKIKSKTSDNELKFLLPILCNKNEDLENYEFSALLKDIINNFDNISEVTKTPVKKVIKTPKTDKTIKKDNI